MDPEKPRELGPDSIHAEKPREMGPDINLDPHKPSEPARLFLPTHLAQERMEEEAAARKDLPRITVPIRHLFDHMDEPGWGDQCLAMIKDQLRNQGVRGGAAVQVILADYTTLRLPQEVIDKIEETPDAPVSGVKANWGRKTRRRFKVRTRKTTVR